MFMEVARQLVLADEENQERRKTDARYRSLDMRRKAGEEGEEGGSGRGCRC